jgi:NAD(P)-dependent dehydrogenase (short-subunit alcohol dehydrogenase family)
MRKEQEMGDLLKDKVTIITGAGRGIGREYALGFAGQGAKLVVVDIIQKNATSVAKEIENKGGEAIAIHADISDEGGTQTVATKTSEKFGSIDILINNAAVYAGLEQKPFYALSVEEWDQMFAVNVKGTWLMCKAVYPFMKEAGKGKIINISSTTASGPRGGALLFHYACTKGTIITMTRLLARTLGESNINVNCIAPGFTHTEASLGLKNQPPGGIAPLVLMQQCFNRGEQPEDLVGTALYLASDLSDFVTGQTIVVDGGSWLR